MIHNNVRLIDIFLSGPIQILVSSYITHKPLFLLRYFILFTGILNIIYNGHNFLLFNSTIKQPLPLIKTFVDLKNGKTQSHRLYNLIIMYPIFIIVLLNIDMPIQVWILFLINITIGVAYNLFYYLTI
jgi:hypothetical protein